MKRFILSVSVLSTLLLAGQYGQAAPATTAVFARATAAPSVTKLPSASLPASVKSYLDQNYKGYSLVKVEKAFAGDGRGMARRDGDNASRTVTGTKVKFLLNNVPFDLFFTANGQFAGTHAPGPRGEVNKSAYLTANQLPASVRDYLGKNYKNYTFLKAETRQSPTGSVRHYNVDILINDQRASLHFDSTGTFRDAHIRAAQPDNVGVSYLSRTELPAPIASVLTSQYASQTYVLGEQRTGPNGIEYAVELASANTLTRLHFDANGNVLLRPNRPDGRGPGGRGDDRGRMGKAPQHGPMDSPGRERPGQDRSGRERWGGNQRGQNGPRQDRVGSVGNNRRRNERPGSVLPGRALPGQGGPQAGGPRAEVNQQILLDTSTLPASVTTYLKANFSGYTFLKANVHNANGTPAEYVTDIAVGKGLYKLRFAANGDVLMAEARN